MEILAHWMLLGVLSTVYAAWGLVHCISPMRAAAPLGAPTAISGGRFPPLSHTQIFIVVVEQPGRVQACLSQRWRGVTTLTGHAIPWCKRLRDTSL